MNMKFPENLSKIIFIIILLFSLTCMTYIFYAKHQISNGKNVTQEMCEEFIKNCKNLKDLILFEREVKELRGVTISAKRDAVNKLEWTATLNLIDQNGFESNNILKEYEFSTLMKRIESLIYKEIKK